MSRPAAAEVERALIEAIRESSGAELSPEQGFFAAGVDSAALVEAHDQVQRRLGIEFPVVAFFRHISPRLLARHLSGVPGDAIRPPTVERYAAAFDTDASVAIIGMGCRLPGAPDVERFWQNLVGGVESIDRLSADRMLAMGVTERELNDPDYVPVAAVMPGYDEFDADLFGMTRREAELCDPQIRAFLEVCHAALENAGYDPFATPGTVAVFGAAGPNRYLSQSLPRLPAPRAADLRLSALNQSDYLASFVSYRLGLRGPSMTALTACSSSLVAVHLAVQALRAGDCDLALAGGAVVELPTEHGYLWTPDGGVSRDGHCRVFDAAASGTVYGSGAGAVVLKRLDAALDAGDSVLAVIRGTSVTNDGADRPSFHAPSLSGQAAAVGTAMKRAGIRPCDVGYVEASAIGNPLGDAVEAGALADAYAALAEEPLPEQSIALGSVKSNIGHLTAAAGVAGLIKTVLMLARETIVPTINVAEPAPALNLAGGPFRVATALRAWPRNPSCPRTAAVSSIGVGGGNAHVLLTEVPHLAQSRPPENEPRILILSARTEQAVREARGELSTWLAGPGKDRFGDAVATLQYGRTSHPVRQAVVCTGAEEAISALADSERLLTGRALGRGSVSFLFPDDREYRPRMARGLYGRVRQFSIVMDECAELFSAAGLPLDEAWEHGGPPSGPAEAGPLLFAVEYAMAKTVAEWGAAPGMLLGQGVGELTAAVYAGMLELPVAVAVAAAAAPTRNGAPRIRSNIAGRLSDCLAGVVARPSRLPVISASSGSPLTTAAAADPGYWTARLGGPSSEPGGLDTLLAEPAARLVQVGPGTTLIDAAGRSPLFDVERAATVATLPHSGEPDRSKLLTAAARLWASGTDVDWSAVGQPPPDRRVALPGYPYQRRRHWIDPPERQQAGHDPASGLSLRSVEWVRRPTGPMSARAPAGGVAVMLTPDTLERARAAVAAVEGAGYLVRHYAPAEVDRMIAEVSAERVPVAALVHATGLAAGAAGDPDRELAGLLAMAELSHRVPQARFLVLTSGAVDVSGAEPVDPTRAASLAVVGAVRAERPETLAGVIDVTGETSPAGLAEELRGPTLAPAVAVRGRCRWVPCERVLAVEAPDRHVLRDRGVYLITGAFGEAGAALARQMAATGARPRIVLLDEAADAGRRHSAALLNGLRLAGAEPHLIAAPLTDRGSLQVALADVTARLGPCHGLVRADSPGSLAAAAAGTANLTAFFERQPPLDFVLLLGDSSPVGAFLATAVQTRPLAGGQVLSMALPNTRTTTRATPEGSPEAAPDAPGPVVWHEVVAPGANWALDEHRIGRTPVMPVTWFLDRVVTGFGERLASPGTAVELTDVRFPVPLSGTSQRSVRFAITPVDPGGEGGRFTFAVSSRSDCGWVEHAVGDLAARPDLPPPAPADLAVLRAGMMAEPVGGGPAGGPFTLGPRWQNVGESWRAGNERLMRLQLMAAFTDDVSDHRLHPALLDTAVAAVGSRHVPAAGCRRMTVFAGLQAALHAHIRWHRNDPDDAVADVRLIAEDGAVLVSLEEWRMRREKPAGAQEQPQSPGPPTASALFAPAMALLAAGVRGAVMAGEGSAAPHESTTGQGRERALDVPARLRELWSATIGTAPAGDDEDFFEAGGDSIAGLELLSGIRVSFSVRLRLETLLDARTFGELRSVLESAVAETGEGAEPR